MGSPLQRNDAMRLLSPIKSKLLTSFEESNNQNKTSSFSSPLCVPTSQLDLPPEKFISFMQHVLGFSGMSNMHLANAGNVDVAQAADWKYQKPTPQKQSVSKTGK